ncbi:MAG: DNA repair exonuclease [Ruminococcaceae bacterium]|nr:DNA repair exonuclease [Oscillospiraceae bacterium]
MKLIHCADLHLDSPMESNLPADRARERRSEILSTFQKLIEHADENGADAILIAGDLFDSKRTAKKTEQYVLSLIEDHPDLEFFYLAGNHDSGNRMTDAPNLPQNLHTFSNRWTSYSIGDVYITGSEAPDPESLVLPEDKINILLLHGQKADGNASADDVLPFGRYKNKNIDYMALGHLHKYQEATLDARGVACYSGCLEGRGFDECGQKGYVLLEEKNGRLSHTFVPFSKRALHEIRCSLTNCFSQTDAERRALQAVEGIPSKDLVKLVLEGAVSAELLIDPMRIAHLLSECFYFAKIANKTRQLVHPENYLHDVSLKGEFVRRVMASSLTESEKERVIACGFRALSGEELDV